MLTRISYLSRKFSLSISDKLKGSRQRHGVTGTPENVASDATEVSAEVEPPKPYVIMNDEIRALEIKMEDLEKVKERMSIYELFDKLRKK